VESNEEVRTLNSFLGASNHCIPQLLRAEIISTFTIRENAGAFNDDANQKAQIYVLNDRVVVVALKDNGNAAFVKILNKLDGIRLPIFGENAGTDHNSGDDILIEEPQ
jgi:hypothetical protein